MDEEEEKGEERGGGGEGGCLRVAGHRPGTWIVFVRVQST